MFKNIKLLSDRILVKPDNPETTTKAGIILAPTKEKRIFTGTVLAVGNGKIIEDGLGFKRQEMEVEVGDTILFPRFVGVNMDRIAEATLILSQRDVLAIIEENDDESGGERK